MTKQQRPAFIALVALALLGPIAYLMGMISRGGAMLQMSYVRLGAVYLGMALSAAAAAYLVLRSHNFLLRLLMGLALVANLVSIGVMGSVWSRDMKRAVVEAEMPPIDAAKVGIVVAPLDHTQQAAKEAHDLENLLATLVRQAEQDALIEVRHGVPVYDMAQAKTLGERMRANVVVWHEKTGRALISEQWHVTVLGANETEMALEPFNLMLLLSTQDTFSHKIQYNVDDEPLSADGVIAPVATGFGFLAVGQPLLAGGQFESVIQNGELDGLAMAKLYNYYGTSVLFVERDDFAVPAYEQSIEIEPNMEAWIGLGNASLLRRDWYAAQSAYEEALALAPYDAAPYCGLGILFARDHDVARAISAHRQAVALAPNQGVPYALLGLTYELDANHEGAREAYALAAQYSGPNAGLHLAAVERADKIVRNPPTPVPTATPLPIPTDTPIPAQATYTIQPNDTLSAIAAEFGVTTEAIMEINRLTSEDFIVVGRELLIPVIED